VLPKNVPSLYGTFPTALYDALEGALPECDLQKAKYRAADDFAKMAADQSIMKHATEEEFRWALSVCESSEMHA
jgi:hypothetical protein